MSRKWLLLTVAAACAAMPVLGASPDLTFRPDGEGCYRFDTGVVRGTLRGVAPWQGLSSLVHEATGVELVHERFKGIFSPYRVHSAGTRYDDGVRVWPSRSRLLPDGAVEVHWPAAEGHPLEITAVYRWRKPDALDMETAVKPQRDVSGLEVYLASYFARDFRASVYVRPSLHGRGGPGLLPADCNPLVEGTYLIFPRDLAGISARMAIRWRRQ